MEQNRTPVTPLRNLLSVSGIRVGHSRGLNSPFRSPLISNKSIDTTPSPVKNKQSEPTIRIGLSRNVRSRNWCPFVGETRQSPKLVEPLKERNVVDRNCPENNTPKSMKNDEKRIPTNEDIKKSTKDEDKCVTEMDVGISIDVENKEDDGLCGNSGIKDRAKRGRRKKLDAEFGRNKNDNKSIEMELNVIQLGTKETNTPVKSDMIRPDGTKTNSSIECETTQSGIKMNSSDINRSDSEERIETSECEMEKATENSKVTKDLKLIVNLTKLDVHCAQKKQSSPIPDSQEDVESKNREEDFTKSSRISVKRKRGRKRNETRFTEMDSGVEKDITVETRNVVDTRIPTDSTSGSEIITKDYGVTHIATDDTSHRGIIQRIDFVKNEGCNDVDDFIDSPAVKVIKNARKKVTIENVEKVGDAEGVGKLKRRTCRRLISSSDDENLLEVNKGSNVMKRFDSNNSFSSNGSGNGMKKTFKRRSLSLKKSFSPTTLTDDEDDFVLKPSCTKRLISDGDNSDSSCKSSQESRGNLKQLPLEKVLEQGSNEIPAEVCNLVKGSMQSPQDDLVDFETPIKKIRTCPAKIKVKDGLNEENKESITLITSDIISGTSRTDVALSVCEENHSEMNITDSVETAIDDLKELRDEVYNLEMTVYEKERYLEELQRAEHYKQIHDIVDLSRRTALWKTGCKEAMCQLLNKLRENLPAMSLKALMLRLKIPPEFLEFDEENDCFK